MAWNLDQPEQVQAMQFTYSEDTQWGCWATNLVWLGDSAYLICAEPAEINRAEEYFWHLSLIDLASGQRRLEFPEIDRAEVGVPCWDINAQFSNRGQRLGVALGNRLLIWDLEVSRDA